MGSVLRVAPWAPNCDVVNHLVGLAKRDHKARGPVRLRLNGCAIGAKSSQIISANPLLCQSTLEMSHCVHFRNVTLMTFRGDDGKASAERERASEAGSVVEGEAGRHPVDEGCGIVGRVLPTGVADLATVRGGGERGSEAWTA